MSESDEVLLVLSTFPDAATANTIAEELVTGSYAACANITTPVQSIYRWQGKLERGAETLVFFKTTRSRFAEFAAVLKRLHPYEVPEIIAVPVHDGLPEYLQWVSENSRALAEQR